MIVAEQVVGLEGQLVPLITVCWGLTCVSLQTPTIRPPNSYVEALTP